MTTLGNDPLEAMCAALDSYVDERCRLVLATAELKPHHAKLVAQERANLLIVLRHVLGLARPSSASQSLRAIHLEDLDEPEKPR